MEKGFPDVTPAMSAARAASRGVQLGATRHDMSLESALAALPAAIENAPSSHRSIAPAVLALGSCGVVALALVVFAKHPQRKRHIASSQTNIVAVTPGNLPPVPLVTITRPSATGVAPAPERPVDYESAPAVPQPYTGDPAGQALWEQIVDEDQQTLQPDDLEQGPPRQLPDLRQYSAYRAQNVDADGNLN